MRDRSLARSLLGAGLLIMLVLAVGACGKRGAPKPPEGQEDAYTYPRFYPGPSKRLPIFGGTPAAAAPDAESVEEKERKKKRRAKAVGKEEEQRRLFREERDFAPFSEGFDTFGTYETSPK